MKMLTLIFTTLVLISVQSNAAIGFPMKCNVVSIPTGPNGSDQMLNRQIDLSITEDSGAPYGLIATYVGVASQKDTQHKIFFKTELPAEFLEMVEVYGPFIPGYSNDLLDQVIEVNIGVENNREDAYGLLLTVAYNSQGKIIGKFIRIGWAFGVCDIH